MKGYKILTFNDIQGGIEKYHKLGANPGFYLGFNSMKEFYSMREDSCTDWTGLPQSGKSELMLECLYNMSEFYGKKHLLCVPDIGDAIELMAILLHKRTGLTFDKKYSNLIDLKTAYKESSWLLEHFHIMEKIDIKTPIISPVEFWEYACEYKKEHGIFSAVIDSWKDLRHDYHLYGGNYAQYLSNVLPLRNHLSEKNKIHFHTVIHPKTPRRDKNGQLAHPQVDDMEGGAQWNNSGKVIISVHRATFDTKTAEVQMLKVKPKVLGKRGFFAINFEPAVSRYYDMSNENGGTKIFAKKEVIEQNNKAMPINIDFSEPIRTITEDPF
jgi:hypothetical protein